MPDIKMLPTEPGIDPGFTHLQHLTVHEDKKQVIPGA
jgi:hypothetical protein